VNFVDVAQTPLAPDRAPVRIAYRDITRSAGGTPLVVLHGGWGYDKYPFDAQIEAFGTRRRIVIPDRSGYGASTPIELLPADFHDRATEETRIVLDALGLVRPILWGHSDGAIIALRLGLAAPDRVSGIIAEATHFYRRKPRSRPFFESVLANAESSRIMKLHAEAWLQIGEGARSPIDDFYGGRLSQLSVPTLVIHGARDPRTEPGEIDALRDVLSACEAARAEGGAALSECGVALSECGVALSGPPIQLTILDRGGHSPHSEPATADEVTALAREFLHD
jgi:pimeloyl-ACP methyl ester carboxylesterase